MLVGVSVSAIAAFLLGLLFHHLFWTTLAFILVSFFLGAWTLTLHHGWSLAASSRVLLMAIMSLACLFAFAYGLFWHSTPSTRPYTHYVPTSRSSSNNNNNNL